MKKILIAEDDATQRRLMTHQLKEAGYEPVAVGSAEEALEKFKEEPPDLVITDHKMGSMTGIELLCEIKRLNPNALVIFMTAFGSIELAVSAMKKGAFDFLTKPYSSDVLLYTIKRAFQVKSLEEENVRLHLELMDRYSFEDIVGGSAPIKELFNQMSKVAISDATCLIEGESGTGKELIARAIHYGGLRKDKPFVAVNCGAIPETLVESELFGHEKGSFTGATQKRIGKFEQAQGGTLFLDEVSTLPFPLQAKLLRVLSATGGSASGRQEKVIERVGGGEPISVDVRVIAASNRPLAKLVEKKEFREDLFYRLNVVPIQVPPLRQRKEDIPLLVRHFLAKHGRPHEHVDHEVLQVFMNYDWPGNIRELENIIERMLILSQEARTLHVKDIPQEIRGSFKTAVKDLHVDVPDEGLSLEELEKKLILRALEKAGSNQTKAASLLGITRQTLIYRMEKHGIKV